MDNFQKLHKLDFELRNTTFLPQPNIDGHGPNPSQLDIDTLINIKKTIPNLGQFITFALNSSSLVNFTRWQSTMVRIPSVQEVLSTAGYKIKIQVPTLETRGKQSSIMRINVPDAIMGKVITRFPPEPSGCLHLGHAKAAFLNYAVAASYNGKLLCRFDDTNPAKESNEFVQAILRDLKRLELPHEPPTFTSSYFDQIEQFAIKAIKDGYLYSSQDTKEDMTLQRAEGLPSPFRDNSVQTSLGHFDEMRQGTPLGKKTILRAKIDYQSKNPALRDPVMYRVVTNPDDSQIHHFRIGQKYWAFPLYDWACPIVDSLEGVTHAMRSQEYHDHDPIYHWVIKITGLNPVHLADYSRLEIQYTTMSKRKLQWFVDEGIASGWDDPRFYTVGGLLRRGALVKSIHEYLKEQGKSKRNVLVEPDSFWTLNKRNLDPIINRYYAVDSNYVRLFLSDENDNPVKAGQVSVPNHPKKPSMGTHSLAFSQLLILDQEDTKTLKVGDLFFLMNVGNALVTSIDSDNGKIDRIDAKLVPSLKTPSSLKVTWLNHPGATEFSKLYHHVEIDAISFGNLIDVKRLGKNDDFNSHVVRDSRWERVLIGEGSFRDLKKGTHLQILRKGYYIVDEPWNEETNKIVLFEIPS